MSIIITKGCVLHEYPRGFVTRGYDPARPTKPVPAMPAVLTEDHPLIRQGMIVTPDATGTKWEIGVSATKAAADQKPTMIGFAQKNSNDADVQVSKRLPAFLHVNDYEFATPFFMRQKAKLQSGSYVADGDACMYTLGTPITYATNDEVDLYEVNENGTTVTKARKAAGFIRPAKAGDVVIGVITSNGKGKNGSDDLSVTQNGAIPMQRTINDSIDSTSVMHNAYIVKYATSFNPVSAPVPTPPAAG